MTPPRVPPAESGWGLATAAIAQRPTWGPAGVHGPGPFPPGAHGAVDGAGLPPGVAPPFGIYRPAPGTPFYQHELASWGARFGACMFNGLVMLGAAVVLMGGAALLAYGIDHDAFSAGPYGDEMSDLAAALLVGAYFLVVLFGVLYDWILIGASGATLGHRVAGIRIRRTDGAPVTWGGAAGRAGLKFLFYTVGGACLSGAPSLASAVTIAATDKRQSLHDMAASTIAVRRDALEARDM